jgi:four helix bundle protein
MISSTKSFFELEVWQKAHKLVLEVYTFSKDFPQSELFGLTSQLRRASVSIPANIAEGYKRIGKPDKIRFYNIAQSSLEEVRYYLFLSKELGYMEDINQLKNLAEEVSKMLDAYIKQIQKNKVRN